MFGAPRGPRRASAVLVYYVLVLALFNTADVKTLEAFHMKCQRQILRIRWQDHVRNDEVAAHTGLRPVMESIRRQREAIFGHVARMSSNIPAHQALRLQVETSLGRRPDRGPQLWSPPQPLDWLTPPGPSAPTCWPMASSHPAWSHWSDATVLDDYAMTTTTTTTSYCAVEACVYVDANGSATSRNIPLALTTQLQCTQ